MSDANTSQSVQAADDYISEQLTVAQGTLGRAKLVSVILIIMVLAYMSFVTKQVMQYLTPSAAAETASAVMLEQIAEHENTIAARLRSYVPDLVEDLPGTTMAGVPGARERIEERLRRELDAYTRLAVWRIEPRLDELLLAHTADFETFLQNPDDVEQIRTALGNDIDALLTDALTASNADGETLSAMIQAYARRLDHLANQTAQLAGSGDLTEQEQFTRHAIATLFANVEIEDEPASAPTASPDSGR